MFTKETMELNAIAVLNQWTLEWCTNYEKFKYIWIKRRNLKTELPID